MHHNIRVDQGYHVDCYDVKKTIRLDFLYFDFFLLLNSNNVASHQYPIDCVVFTNKLTPL